MVKLFSNEYFHLLEQDNIIFIHVTQPKFPLLQFEDVLNLNPRIEITKFLHLKKALEQASSEDIEIGRLRPTVDLNLSSDQMEAKVKIYALPDEFDQNKEQYIQLVFEALTEQQITEGILIDVIRNGLKPLEEIIVAKGTPPTHGENAIIRYFELSDRKPTIREDGRADYYDMNFIDEIKAGDWLGEKIPPTEGKPGATIKGEILQPRKGKDARLLYDPKTVTEVREGNKTVLRAKIDGIVAYNRGKIGVGRHLKVDGDVGVETGNLEFDGSVTITGTVQEGYSVIATEDISVLSEEGVSGCHLIESKTGDVFVKGGIFGKDHSIIKAGRNIFVKYANHCTLLADENIHIGYYSIGSTLKGINIETDKEKGKLIGGNIEAKAKVLSGYLGNRIEQKTFILVQGFNRLKVKEEFDQLLRHYKSLLIQLEEVKRELEIYEASRDQLDECQLKEFEKHEEAFDDLIQHVTSLESERKRLMYLLQTKGDGQVTIFKEAYPQTFLEIKQVRKKIQTSTTGTIYALGKELRYE